MKLTLKEKYSYGVGALGKDLVYAIVSTYLMFYLTDVVGLAPAFVGGLFLVARLWDAINDPIMGMIVDNTRSKWGKFRPWIFIGTILNAITLVLLFTKPNLEGSSLYIYFGIVYILWGMTYTIMDIPYWSMIPSLSSDKSEREKISVIPRIFASSAWFIVGTFGLIIVSKLGLGNDIKGYGRFSIIIAIVFVITSVITCVNVKEKNVTSKNAEKTNLKKAFGIIRNNDQLIVFIGIILAFNLVFQLSGGIAIYYFKYAVGNEKLFPVFTGFAAFGEIAGLFMFPVLTKLIGRQKVFKLGALVPVIGFILLLVAGIFMPQNAILIAIAGIIYKLGSGLILGASTVMLADVVDYGEFKLGTRNESIVFSVQTLLVKTASAVSGWLIGVGLSLVGYVAGAQQTAFTIMSMRVLMIVIPAILIIVCYIIYKKHYKLNGEYHDDIILKLEKRNSNIAV